MPDDGPVLEAATRHLRLKVRLDHESKTAMVIGRSRGIRLSARLAAKRQLRALAMVRSAVQRAPVLRRIRPPS